MKQRLILLFLIGTFHQVTLFSSETSEGKKQTFFDRRPQVSPLSQPDDEWDYEFLPEIEGPAIAKTDVYGAPLPEEWLLDHALDYAPATVTGIIAYLRLRATMRQFKDFELADSIAIPSYHRFILVGPPGSGKTTMAYGIAHSLGFRVAYIAAASLFGQYRNQTGINISQKLKELTVDPKPIVIIIDELHKLFEHHANTQSDDSQTSAAFWLALDQIERGNPHAVIIGTANNVDKLPSEIKSRFAGKIISIPMPNEEQKHYSFKKMLRKDKNIVLEEGCDTLFLQNIISQMSNCSLRDLQLLIDAAKIIYYSENPKDPCDMRYRASRISFESRFVSTILLTKKHFQQALDQLKAESSLTKESFFESDKFSKKLQNWSAVLSIAVSAISLAYWGNTFIIKPVVGLFEQKGVSIHG